MKCNCFTVPYCHVTVESGRWLCRAYVVSLTRRTRRARADDVWRQRQAAELNPHHLTGIRGRVSHTLAMVRVLLAAAATTV
jgi:hypothetical protein